MSQPTYDPETREAAQADWHQARHEPTQAYTHEAVLDADRTVTDEEEGYR